MLVVLILPVQTQLLLPPNPSEPTLTHPSPVPDNNKVLPGISWNLPEIDAGDLAGYIVHGLQHFPPV